MDFVIYSGGLDSFTLLNDRVEASGKDNVTALSFFYGQRHQKELLYAERVCKQLGVAHSIIELGPLFQHISGSALTDKTKDIPEGHYQDDTMKQTIVPGRNTIMLSIAMGIAEAWVNKARSEGALYFLVANVFYGAHAGDHAIYPDCRPKYIEAMSRLVYEATDNQVIMHAPFKSMNKGEIVRKGLTMGLDYSKTWTCYKGGDKPCGKCGSCIERKEAFAQNNALDPLVAE